MREKIMPENIKVVYEYGIITGVNGDETEKASIIA